MLTPVPDVSVMFHDRRTAAFPPIHTELGVAEKELIVAPGQALAVTVRWAVAEFPQPFLAVRVYVVVDCGWVISTKPLAPAKVPTPEIVTLTPLPDVSLIDHARRTIWLPPIRTDDGVAVNDVMLGAGHAVTVTVTVCVRLHVPFLLSAVSVYVVVPGDGETERLPDAATGEPLSKTCEAFAIPHERVLLPPCMNVVGEAVNGDVMDGQAATVTAVVWLAD